MTPYFLAQISPHPMQGGDQYQSYLPFTLANDTSSFSFPILLSNPQDQGVSGRDHHPQQQLLAQQAPFEPSMISGSSDQSTNFPINTNNGNIVEPSFFADPYVRQEDHRGSGKWMSSKMRVMQKMMNPDGIVTNKPRKKSEVHLDQQQPSQQDGIAKDNMINGSPCGIIRVCSDCNTTKTPLWRSGPRGPKSLCNACGIRQRKARRAMAAASLNGGLPPTDKRSKARKEKNSEIDRSIPFKKRYKIATAGDQTAKKTLLFDDITISMSKDSAFPRVFPQDERDAAILLMALSCGLVRS